MPIFKLRIIQALFIVATFAAIGCSKTPAGEAGSKVTGSATPVVHTYRGAGTTH